MLSRRPDPPDQQLSRGRRPLEPGPELTAWQIFLLFVDEAVPVFWFWVAVGGGLWLMFSVLESCCASLF